jgi:hypothetical protein
MQRLHHSPAQRSCLGLCSEPVLSLAALGREADRASGQELKGEGGFRAGNFDIVLLHLLLHGVYTTAQPSVPVWDSVPNRF